MRTRAVNSGWACRLLGAIALAAQCVAATLSTAAAADTKSAAIVIDANTGETLLADRADEIRHPASLTKMMTLYLVFETFETGRLKPSTKIKISQEAASAQPTKVGLEPGEEIAAMDAVKSLITKSANDMAIALAETIGGSEANFVALMNKKARALGMQRTTFRNASGLPDPGQVTTARDMVTLGLKLQDDFPKYYPLFALRSFSYNGTTYRNHNTMLNSFDGIDGIKTGYTRMSGFNLVTSLRRGDKHLVGAVFGGATAGTRNLTMRMLLTRALLRASTKKTRNPAPMLVAQPRPALHPAKPKIAMAAAAQPAAQRPARPAPQPDTSTPAAAAVVAPTPAAAPAQVAVAEPRPAPAIEIARVRPVMVAPRIKRTAFVVPPSSETSIETLAAAAADVKASPVTASPTTPAIEASIAALTAPEPVAAVVPPVRVEPAPVPQAQAPTPQAFPQRSALGGPTPAPMPAAALPAAPSQPSQVQRGLPPSTLQAQAHNLARAAPPQVQPVPYAAAAAGGGLPMAASSFQIQIGAYASAGEAERALRDTQARSNGILGSATPLTTPVQKENRLLYRARFAGFNAQAAANTCLALRRAAIDCFVMKAE